MHWSWTQQLATTRTAKPQNAINENGYETRAEKGSKWIVCNNGIGKVCGKTMVLQCVSCAVVAKNANGLNSRQMKQFSLTDRCNYISMSIIHANVCMDGRNSIKPKSLTELDEKHRVWRAQSSLLYRNSCTVRVW